VDEGSRNILIIIVQNHPEVDIQPFVDLQVLRDILIIVQNQQEVLYIQPFMDESCSWDILFIIIIFAYFNLTIYIVFELFNY
jgi:hypothetical protein